MLGYEQDDTRDMQFGGRTHPEDLPGLMTLYRDIIRGKQSYSSMEVRVRHKQGDWRRILFNFSPLFDESSKIEGVVLSGRDVTDLKRLEEQLIQAEKLAAMGQMLAGVAHELNNPLAIVMGRASLLEEKCEGHPELKADAARIHEAAERCGMSFIERLCHITLEG